MKRILLSGLVCLCALAAPLAAENSTVQGFQILFTFDKTDGNGPVGITQGIDGNFYGVTISGGANNNEEVCGQGVACGTVFKVSPSGTLKTIYNFCALDNCSDGAAPIGLLALGMDGNFYGVTSAGGNTNVNAFGSGTVFQITPAGKLTTLYTFCSKTGCPDGREPASLALGFDGSFYGTTLLGGNQSCTGGGCGTLFEITPEGKLTTLYSFCAQTNCADGSHPNPLIQASDSYLYGTTQAGGNANDAGTVFLMSTTGALRTLYSFCAQSSCDDGSGPMAGLLQGADGNFYGTTYLGGSGGEGTVFEISPEQLTTISNFCLQSGCPGGGEPVTSLVQATDGNLYGSTLAGGGTCFIEVVCGTLYQTTTAGELSTLYTFCSSNTNCDLAREPAGLVQGTDGNFYGTTILGGTSVICSPYGCGTFYRDAVSFGPFVSFVNRAAQVGAEVGILGQDLKSASAVSFNGVSAAFTARSNTFLTATVPSGATSGTVSVTTANGTLQSNVPFQVFP